jgi:hypothetical protein
VDAHVVLVEIAEVLLLEVGALDLIGGAVAFGYLHAVGDAAHLEVRHGRALAGMDVLGVDHDGELACEVEHVAFAHRACDNLGHVAYLRWLGKCGVARRQTEPSRLPSSAGSLLRPALQAKQHRLLSSGWRSATPQ